MTKLKIKKMVIGLVIGLLSRVRWDGMLHRSIDVYNDVCDALRTIDRDNWTRYGYIQHGTYIRNDNDK